MSDIELLVKIPEEIYKASQIIDVKYEDVIQIPLEVIAKGTPLPTGHRFIDADEILNHAFIRDDEEGDIFVQKYYCIKKEIMDNALVLFDTLEADKEQEE
jgi:hypothetical protein